MRFALSICFLTACASSPGPLRAVVDVSNVGPHSGPDPATVLALPSTCVADEPALCEVATYYTNAANAPTLTFDEIIYPLIRLKLELAGYTLVDARTLRLVTAERTDVISDGETSTKVEDIPTVANLTPPEMMGAAQSIQLAAMLTPTLILRREHHRVWLELVLQLRGVPDGDVKWTVRCSEPVDVPYEAANLVASCVGDGVLAWRAPEALIGRAR